MNRKSVAERVLILNLIVEGNSLRSVARLSGSSLTTVTSLLRRAGRICQRYHDDHVNGLNCRNIQVDEIWSFIQQKDKNYGKQKRNGTGSIWTWIAICTDSKFVPCWYTGNRDDRAAKLFIGDLASRMATRIHLVSDGLAEYKTAVEEVFGDDIDYGMVIKVRNKNRYIGSIRSIQKGEVTRISTSHIERLNLTIRMINKRFARQTNAHSKTLENHKNALALMFMYYNFCRIHSSLRITPAMAAGVTARLWEMRDIVELMD